MQENDGRLTMLTGDEVIAEVIAGRAGRIISEGEDVQVVNQNETRANYVIESVGRRFVTVRAKAGHSFVAKQDEEITIKDCAFVVRRITRRGRTLLLEGIPPEPTADERGTS
jgi:hypothetical protein